MKKPIDIKAVRLKEAAEVAAYMKALKHPLKAEVEALRQIITGTSKKFSERIKWNGPSYYCGKDLVTFSLHARDRICLVFHQKNIVTIDSPLLLGDYKDRRLMYFRTKAEITAGTKELRRILRTLLKSIEQ
jgi:carboxylesterase type B